MCSFVSVRGKTFSKWLSTTEQFFRFMSMQCLHLLDRTGCPASCFFLNFKLFSFFLNLKFISVISWILKLQIFARFLNIFTYKIFCELNTALNECSLGSIFACKEINSRFQLRCRNEFLTEQEVHKCSEKLGASHESSIFSIYRLSRVAVIEPCPKRKYLIKSCMLLNLKHFFTSENRP